MLLPQLRRVRWAVRATLTLGVAASVAANILHAKPNPVSQVIAAWPPLALLLTVELISRIPVHRRSLAAVRLAATTTIAGIAAWVSYWHMAGVAARYGETGPSPYLLPLSVDGLVIVASVSLVELAGRIRADETGLAETAETDVTGTAVVEAAVVETAVAGPDGATLVARPVATTEAVVVVDGPTAPDEKTTPPKAVPRKVAAARDTPPGTSRSVAEIAEFAARLKADRPELTQAAIAAELGITAHRLRQATRQAVAAA
ncbi:MAG TPA: DUF2637 domain-containing protein [Planosporangium sp.]|nr:DUF2637 domain-containing protein [Planosporangium sp.]